jgi:hypothetical protein
LTFKFVQAADENFRMKMLIPALSAVLAAVMPPVVAECNAQDAPPSAVQVARTTAIPACTAFVDARAASNGDGTASRPYSKIAEAVAAAASGAVLCVAEGIYAEEIVTGEKPLTLAGGFQSGSNFSVRDSAKFVSRAQGDGGGSFLRVEDPAPTGDQLTAVDGFEITGYERAIVRQYWEPQRFDITNNYIHDNKCSDLSLVGAAFAIDNVSGTISGNVIANNSCGRGGGGFINDGLNKNTVTIESNWIEGNSGVEPGAHGGGLYLFANRLVIRSNVVVNNKVTQWGGGIYIGAFTPGGQFTNAELSLNVYRGNQAGDSGGGFFCDDGAACTATHEIYDRNCGGNVLVDGGSEGSGPTVSVFKNITNVGALTPDCSAPGIGFWMDTYEAVAADKHAISDSVFWGNAPGADLAASCGSRCELLSLSVDHSLVQQDAMEDGVKIKFGGNIVPSADPLFMAPDKGDFRLNAGSPAIGKGTAGGDLGADRDGAPRETIARSSAPTAAAAEPVRQGGVLVEPVAPAAPAVAQVGTQAAGAASPSERADDPAAKDAFEAARELGTVEAWAAFLEYYPTGFYSALARGYLAKLGASTLAATAPQQDTAGQATAESSEPASRRAPAVARAGDYMGFPEQFNRYYTDPAWKPEAVVYVSPTGGGDGSARSSPMQASEAVAAAQPGTMIIFTRGAYQGGFEFAKESSGTYDQPIVVYGDRQDDGSIGVTVDCQHGKRLTCFNVEAADYVAIDGFELVGGRFGVRSVGLDFSASQHNKGLAVLDSIGHDQDRDPFLTGHSDWAVFEGNVAYGAKKGDGHGFYISNGGDWNIVRFNETYGNASSDFQINADPASVCQEVGVPYDDPQCDAYAGEGEGGQGASDYMLVDSNYFHHSQVGANFTGVRRSLVRNNIFGPQERHNVSFWQETDNPKLGSSDNLILHNLFITNGRNAVQFIQNSTRNAFHNNLILGVTIGGGKVAANPSAQLLEEDGTVAENDFAGNVYVSGTIVGRQPNDSEAVLTDFDGNWFAKFPLALNHDAGDLLPKPDAPFLAAGAFHPGAPFDLRGVARSGEVDAGPFELP